MRALFLLPGDGSVQLQAFAAAAAVAEQLGAEVQVVCPTESTALWGLHPAVSRSLAFNFADASLADWANLLGSVREPDFQLCINRARGRQVNLMLSMSHIPTRVAAEGFAATERVASTPSGWPNQNDWEAFLKPIGVGLQADAFRLSLARADLDNAAAELPAGEGPLLLLAPSGEPGDWPQHQWQALPERVRQQLPSLRCQTLGAGSPRQRAARLAIADVVLASDALSMELALLLGLPLVALGRGPESLPPRQGVKGVGATGMLPALDQGAVLAALGFS